MHILNFVKRKGGRAMLRHTIRFSLFVTYAIIILVCFLALSVFAVIRENEKLHSQLFRVLRQNAQVISASIDGELNQMNSVSLNVGYSDLLKKLVSQSLDDEGRLVFSSNIKSITDQLSSIIGPNRPVDQVNLYGASTGMVAAGLANGYEPVSAKDASWYAGLQESNLNRSITYSGEDASLSKYSTDPDGKRFISLARVYTGKLWTPQGFVEVKSSVRRVMSAALNYSSVYGEEIAVFDPSGTPVLPRGTSLGQLWPDLQYMDIHQEPALLKVNGIEGYALCAPSSMSDFKTLIFIPKSEVIVPTLDYLREVSGIALAMLFFALILAYIAARRITDPIKRISGDVAAFNPGAPSGQAEFQTKVEELATLYDGFRQMQTNIEDGLQRELNLQAQEMQSRMLALQSQMNPHFLYNSLAAIQSMADEGMAPEIIDMCQMMSRILRYISSDSGALVPVRDELNCARDYLQCIALRYAGDLSYSIEIPDEIMEIRVPKLCLQLLCENAVKYVTEKRPPWHIRVSGAVEADRYELVIRDNGPGFSAEAIEALNRAVREIDETGLLPTLSIGGMGLLNIYMRYKLFCRQEIIFSVSNNPEGGACVRIGGKYEQ